MSTAAAPQRDRRVNRWMVVGPLVGLVVGVFAAPVGIVLGGGTALAGGFMAWQKDSRWKVVLASGLTALVVGSLMLAYWTVGGGSGSGGSSGV